MSGEFSWAQDTSPRYGLQLYYNIEYIDNGRGIMSCMFFGLNIVFKRHICAVVIVFFLLNNPSASLSFSLTHTHNPVLVPSPGT